MQRLRTPESRRIHLRRRGLEPTREELRQGQLAKAQQAGLQNLATLDPELAAKRSARHDPLGRRQTTHRADFPGGRATGGWNEDGRPQDLSQGGRVADREVDDLTEGPFSDLITANIREFRVASQRRPRDLRAGASPGACVDRRFAPIPGDLPMSHDGRRRTGEPRAPRPAALAWYRSGRVTPAPMPTPPSPLGSLKWLLLPRVLLLRFPLVFLLGWAAPPMASAQPADPPRIRLGIIGLDTSHALAFTKLLNDPDVGQDLAGCRVVAAYPPGSPDIASSVERVPGYTQQMRELGIEIVASIDELLSQVDGVLLETNDGRPHLAQIRPVLAARKPVFVDKPVAGSLADVLRIYQEAAEAGVPIFSSSGLRYAEAPQAVRAGAIGEVIGCDAYSPCSLEATHPDLFWYGIHGVETLYTVMGTGCERVSRMSSEGTDVVVGQWQGGRIGTFRGIRAGQGGYGGTAFGTREVRSLGGFDGYRPLAVQIVKFFRTGRAPVDPRETVEIYAFMAAADESKRRGGAPVSLSEVMEAAQP